jgi:hypothetical protein
MKNGHYFSGILSGLLFFTMGCSRHVNAKMEFNSDGKSPIENSENTNGAWNPNTERLDDTASQAPEFVSLDHDVKNFYAILHQKDWKSTYQLRWKSFKRSMPETTYLDWAKEEGTNWELANYEILSVQMYNNNDAILICKFIELPGPLTSYSVVNWRKEQDGVWRCDSAGPDR